MKKQILKPKDFDPKEKRFGVTVGDRIRFWNNYNSELLERISVIKAEAQN